MTRIRRNKLTSQKTINSLTTIHNNCLRRVFDVYKIISIAELKIKTHISFIDIHLNKLQIKIKHIFQNLDYYERIEKIEKKNSSYAQRKKKQT